MKNFTHIIAKGDSSLAQELAHKKLEELELKKPIRSKPIEALKNDLFFEDELAFDSNAADLVVNLNPACCLGRVAISAAYIEKYFLQTFVAAGDVVQNCLRQHLMENQVDGDVNGNLLEEVLFYEQAHSVILINGEQFDPMSLLFEKEVKHDQIIEFPVWELIFSGILCSAAYLAPDFKTRKNLVDKAEKTAKTTEVLYEKASLLMMTGDWKKVVAYCKKILKRKKSAKALYLLYIATRNPEYKEELEKTYTPTILDMISPLSGKKKVKDD